MSFFASSFWRYAVVFITAAGLWTVWLPLARTLAGGDSYAWANDFFNNVYRGRGLDGDYLFLIYQAALGAALLWMGLRNPRAPYGALLLFWHGVYFLDSLYRPLIAGERNIFVGDTAGVRADLTYVAPVLSGLALLAAALWVIAQARRGETFGAPTWRGANTFFAAIFALYIVATVALERAGAVHGTMDLIAVVLNVAAPLLLFLAFFPYGARRG